MQTNYFKIGLYITGTIAVLVAIYMIFRAFSRAKAGIATIGDSIQDSRNDTAISTETGLSKTEVAKARRIAKDLAEELETLKDMSWWNKQKNIVTDSEIMDIINQVNSAAMLKTIAHIYQNESTNNHNLKADLKSELSNSLFLKVPFIESII